MKAIIRYIFILTFLIFTSCQVNTDKKNLTESNDQIKVDDGLIADFKWIQLSDTAKYKVRYIQLNFLNYPDEKYLGKNILYFKDSISNNYYILNRIQIEDLLKLITDTNNFSEGDCGTYCLNAGIVVLEKNKICAMIDIGCAYNQWNFNPKNLKSKNGHLNEKGFRKMEKLLDNINLKNTKHKNVIH